MGWAVDLSIRRYRVIGEIDFATDEFTSPWGRLRPGNDGKFYPSGLATPMRVAADGSDWLATSSGGTQAGLVAGCRLHGLRTRIIGVSADDPAPALRDAVARIATGVLAELGSASDVVRPDEIEADDSFVGDGYGIPTDASREAQQLAARREALFVDHTYSAKALAALIAYARRGDFAADRTVLFWHTGGQVGLFA
jgi:1-aminocyclopropane-1-carboxylate deaminase/D-cysteine desulfhydrase-like pyridoxal-dependent ACC family enzyme